MTLFIVHQNPSRSDDQAFVFLKDGFNWLAFLLPPLWALVNRLWLPLLAILVLIPLLISAAGLFSLPFLWLYLLVAWWLAMAASSITGFFLIQRGWSETQYVEAPDMETAEQIFFSSLPQIPEKFSTDQSPAQPLVANSDALI
ncbi:hypothetical protein MNBD_ALPHA11-2424 [hydrothermal vent metagenome]|uniref:DUF2628 domain-containing protein n=1 Tax=hydrothermal vent metagenome TaxID=652676 RepID=A0A3B0TL64_9ZZZZ